MQYYGRPRTALQALGLGNVQVLADPAVQVPPMDPSAHPDDPAHPDHPSRRGEHRGHVTHYHEPGYNHSDDCHLGCANGSQNGAYVPGASGIQGTIVSGVPTSPYKPLAMIIPSYQQVGLYIAQITIGPFNAIEGDPIPAAGHSEVSLNQFVSWPTIQANSPIRFSIINASGLDIGAVDNSVAGLSIDVRGIRLRE